jgi:hypothetical protein
MKITSLLALIFLAQTAIASPSDESISQSGDWQANVVSNDLFWQKPACVASTTAADGISSLEVIAFYDEKTEKFTEPTVHIITSFDFSFFQVEAIADNNNNWRFDLLPVALPQDQLGEEKMVGARALFDDREDLTRILRQRNWVNARYFDSQGEVKNIRFSLRGSSNTIGAMFRHCQLQFTPLTDFEPLPELY